jgi:hypothetical protein
MLFHLICHYINGQYHAFWPAGIFHTFGAYTATEKCRYTKLNDTQYTRTSAG